MSNTHEQFHEAWSETAHRAWQIAEDHGFHEDAHEGEEYDTKKLMLVVSEVIEAFEEIRDGHEPQEVYFRHTTGEITRDQSHDEGGQPFKPEGVPIELADAVIRIMDYCLIRDIDLAAAIEIKMQYNESRPHKHGRNF